MATAAAAVVARARRRILDHFLLANAVSPNGAVSFSPSGLVGERQFDRLLRAEVIREAGPDRYWIDVPSYRRWQNRRRRRVALSVMLSAAVAGVATLLA